MRSSDLTHRISLQRVTESRDSFGDPVASWSELGQVWAAIEWAGGGESLQADRQYAEVPAAIDVRRSTTTMSVREKDRAMVPAGATKLRSLISSTSTTMVIEPDGIFPPENEFVVRINRELALVTAGSGTTASPYTISRGKYGTTPALHKSGTSVIHMQPLDIVSVTPSRYSMRLQAVRGEVRST